MASGIGAAWASGIDSMGSSSCYAYLACGDTRGVGLGRAPRDVE